MSSSDGGAHWGRVDVVVMSQPATGHIEDSPFQFVLLTMRFEKDPSEERVLAFRVEAAEVVAQQLTEYASAARTQAAASGKPL